MDTESTQISKPLNPVPPLGCGCGATSAPARQRRRTGLFGLLPGILLALTPKCPFCWAAYMGALSSVGISLQIPFQPWLLPLLGGLLLVNLAVLFSRTKARGDYGPFLLCVTGSATIALGKFALDSGFIVGIGLVGMLAGSIWSVATRGKR